MGAKILEIHGKNGNTAPSLHMTLSPRNLLFPLGFIFLCFFPAMARGQLDVKLEMDRRIYLAHEPITATLTLINRAGRDVVLGGKDSSDSWLDYRVFDGGGNLLGPNPGTAGPGPLIVKNGDPYRTRVAVNALYPIFREGTYRVQASIYFPPLRRYFETPSQTVQVVDVKSFWSQIVGMPPGHPDQGSYRKYELIRFSRGEKNELYVRVSDSETNVVKATFSLGSAIMIRDPEIAVDNYNELHVLFMGAPKAYAYTVINQDGEIEKREVYFEERGNRPQLIKLPDGTIELIGGISEEEKNQPYEKNSFRPLSERPPGMPNL